MTRDLLQRRDCISHDNNGRPGALPTLVVGVSHTPRFQCPQTMQTRTQSVDGTKALRQLHARAAARRRKDRLACMPMTHELVDVDEPIISNM